MKVYKNFLDKKDFNLIKDFIMAPNMPWYCNPVLTNPNRYLQFSYAFVTDGGLINCSPSTYQILSPIISKIKPEKITRIKANLLVKDHKIIEHGFHVDQEIKNGMTGIFYINTCNGYTKFKDGTKINSVENQYVEFDSTMQHTGSTCTDKDRRLVINFNYVSASSGVYGSHVNLG